MITDELVALSYKVESSRHINFGKFRFTEEGNYYYENIMVLQTWFETS